jgi:hypothetical protein
VHEIPCSGCRTIPRGRAYGQTDVTKLRAAFRKFAKTLKNWVIFKQVDRVLLFVGKSYVQITQLSGRMPKLFLLVYLFKSNKILVVKLVFSL